MSTTARPRALIDDETFRPEIDENGLYLLRFRYLARDERGEITEEPVELFRRVARNLAAVERSFDPALDEDGVAAWADRFFRLMTSFRFLPNAPTLLGAGTPLQQLHACFVLPVGDSIDEVFAALRMAAVVHSKGGGTGFSFSGLRGRGEPIATGGFSTGVVPFLRLFDHETELIKHGGTGWGANMGVLSADHPDVEEFVRAKSDGTLQNFNLSVAVTDEFMEDARRGVGAAARLLDLIGEEAWKTGDPGLLFLDRIESDNPTPALGRLEATNPCGEAPLLPFESCCLGGLNVSKFVDAEARTIRWDDLREAAALALRMMDNVIEASRYPLPEIAAATLRTRKVGIGVMGFADALLDLGVPYDSPEAAMLAGELMRELAAATRAATETLAATRGSFPAFEQSVFAGGPPLRNATTTSNAPNSTIGAIAGCSAGIEPLFALGYVKQLANGDRLEEVNPRFVAVARERGFYSEELRAEICERGTVAESAVVPDDVRRLFRTAHEIEPSWHIRIQSAFQAHTDLGISKTINLPNEAEPADVRSAYLEAHERGCKGVTVYRDGCLGSQFLAVRPAPAEDCAVCE